MSYSTLAQPCQASLTIKKSEFLAFAYPINNKEQIMFHVEHLRQTYPDARHICTAYIIGNPNNTTSAGFDDDGEPNGTAGKPILNVLQHKAIGNCLVAVVRYFGGIKLGASGLTRAYSNATQAVVDKMILTAFIPTTILTIQMDFANEAFVRHILTSFDAVILSVDYDKLVNLSIEIAENQCQQFEQKLGIYAKIVKTVYK